MGKVEFSKDRDEVEALRQRIEVLSTVILRVSDSLETSVVLQEVVNGACTLTGADSGVICTIDEIGEVREFYTCGVSAEEKKSFMEWADGPRMFEHLKELPGPIRLADLPDYAEAEGFSPELMTTKTFLSMPLRHHGELVGSFFLGRKDGAIEFTLEDEETSAVFASQAATAIANARAFANEEQALEELAAVVETSPIGVAVFDARTGRAKSFNREARRLMNSLREEGQEEADLLTTLTCRFEDGREIDLKELPFVRVMADAETMRADATVISNTNGQSIKTLLNVTPIRSEGGETVTVVVTLQDLEPLDEVERLCTEFVSMVSHELRGPLAAIKGSAATVLESTRTFADEEMVQFFRIVNAQADQMQGLIGDLLDAGRVEMGALSVYPEPCDLVDLIDRARNMLLGGRTQHTLRIDVPPDLERVMADPERIIQVLGNLLANAAKHSPVSSPITISAVQDGVHVSVSVVDRGPGVDPAILPRLFRKHGMNARGKPCTDRVSGLGLAICKGLVEAHGGRIHAENLETGNGSRFVFTLPLASSSEMPRDFKFAEERIHDSKKPCILVVDDDPVMLRYLRNTLDDAGYKAVVSANPEDISSLIRDEEPSLVLLDLVLPGLDGIELMSTIPEFSDIPVIFISGYGRDETIARALGSGAADYIVKPFSPMELCARVTSVLRLQKNHRIFSCHDLTIDFTLRRVCLGGQEITLTPKEYELLTVLSQNAGKVLTFEYIRRHVWHGRGGEDTQRVRLFIRKLRIKLRDDASYPKYIFNVHGVGYRMSDAKGTNEVNAIA